MKAFYILGHLGLGDHIICNGLVRYLAESGIPIRIPCYNHNLKTISFMFQDLKNVEAIGVHDEAEAILLCDRKECLRLGFYSNDNFDKTIFDREFYRQAKVPFEYRWSKFKVDLPEKEIDPIHVEPCFAFIHEDHERGAKIDYSKIDESIGTFVQPNRAKGFFENIHLIQSAKQIHCIDSSFLCFIDSLPDIEGQKLFLHKYARDTYPPTLKRKWTVL